MLRSIWCLAIVSALAVCAATLTSNTSNAGGIIGGPNAPCDSIGLVPILSYDVTGSSLLGPLHTHLTVYNNGFATISRVNETVFPTQMTTADAATANAGAQAADQLAQDLLQAGAFKLCDQSLIVFDVPLQTVTVHRGNQANQKTRTFSYWIGGGEYAGVQTAISSFIQTHFPNF